MYCPEEHNANLRGDVDNAPLRSIMKTNKDCSISLKIHHNNSVLNKQ